MSVLHLNPEEFTKLSTTPGIYFLDFSAEWCPPCKVMKPIFEHFSNDQDLSHIQFCEVDVDEQPEISGAYNVSSIPTFLILSVTKTESGEITLSEVKRWIGAQNDPIGFKTDILRAAGAKETVPA
jgi:thioredoxin 1